MKESITKRYGISALAIAAVVILLALNMSILVLAAKVYNLTKQLPRAQVPVYNTGSLHLFVQSKQPMFYRIVWCKTALLNHGTTCTGSWKAHGLSAAVLIGFQLF